MAKTTYKENTYKNQGRPTKSTDYQDLWGGIWSDDRFRLALGLLNLILAFSLFVSFFSYFFTAVADQSIVQNFFGANLKESGKEVENWMGLTGAVLAHLFIFRWFGIAAFILIPVLFLLGWKLAFKTELVSISRFAQFSAFFILWISIFLGYITTKEESNIWSGGIGFEVSSLLDSLFGIGTILVLAFVFFIFISTFFDLKEISEDFKRMSLQFNHLINQMRGRPSMEGIEIGVEEKKRPRSHTKANPIEEIIAEEDDFSFQVPNKDFKKTQAPRKSFNLELEFEEGQILDDNSKIDIPVQIETTIENSILANDLNRTDGNFGTEEYDPTLELGSYQKPLLELLPEAPQSKRQVTNEELEANKDRIVDTLSNYGIGISQIKATIGPTVTLYEIIPEAGVRISKIKSLEDDIALSLAALGIRIIAPIPGKGTIGIEVPNKRREIVAMRSVLTDEAFTNSDKDLPVILGKTISNEVFVADLAKMPHLLIAGATGQGKSVALNTFMVSLLYKKHPAELKFVLVDPKKVEMSLFNTIEKHFLAKLPGEVEAIITDNKKVVNTLNSLCIEMENRYNLLKEAACRNIKEYNRKFYQRKLNPRKGHFFMPYLVLVIDELADLMMTAGKEVEQPIARLAQLARAVGIHLIVATQRPSVNVITGIIKANFPARLSFKVTSKIDSRTILDTGGAEQLVGMGDMLFSMGSEIIRLQGAFLDTFEVEKICEFIGNQQGYPQAYELPEFISDEEKAQDNGDVEMGEKDALFEEAARIIVMHQQGSTSLLQRRLKLGYNRAGRLIDQLEKAGIVGPFEGSKAREVLVPDEYTLERLLNGLNR